MPDPDLFGGHTEKAHILSLNTGLEDNGEIPAADLWLAFPEFLLCL